jgi:dephospho-CoA kinase
VLIGLTGNIATGKSTVASILRALGAEVIDADQIARQVVQPGRPAFAQVVQTFGREVLLPSGELDRAKLACLVFGDQAKLQQLEAIVHPAVRRAIQQMLGDRQGERVIALEAIKLIEVSWDRQCDQVWVTYCLPDQQIARLVHLRGMSVEDARLRVAAQAPQADKIARADVLIDTTQGLNYTRQQVFAAWEML